MYIHVFMNDQIVFLDYIRNNITGLTLQYIQSLVQQVCLIWNATSGVRSKRDLFNEIGQENLSQHNE